MNKTEIFQHIFSTCFQSHRTSRKQSRDKKPFFITFKKVTFSVCRILNAKTKKSEVFLKHFFNIDFIWGKSTFPKIAFLQFVSSIRLTFFIENIVSLYYSDFEIVNFCHYLNTTHHQHHMLINAHVVNLY